MTSLTSLHGPERTVVPFEPEHWDVLAAEALAKYSFAFDGRSGQLYKEAGPAYTALVDGVPVAAAGVIQHWRGTGTAWLLISEGARRNLKFVYRAVLHGLIVIIQGHGFRRIEANVDAGLGAAHRLVQHIGFERESIMPKYGPSGETFFKYVLLVEGVR